MTTPFAVGLRALHSGWKVPLRFNIGTDACDKWADGSGRLALIHERNPRDQQRVTFDELKRWSDQLANLWRSCGVKQGDRIAILLPQSPETAIAHIAAYKLGAIAVPLFVLFGPDALRYRLLDSGARLIVTDPAGATKIEEVRPALQNLEFIWCTDIDTAAGVWRPFWRELGAQSSMFHPVETRADDPALIIYTSGTTGGPKGALHAHRVLLGHLPGVEMSHDGFPQPGDLIWTPADWAWIGGLLDVLLPAWHHGIPVLARRFEKFDPALAFDLMARHSVRNAFLPPTALKMMRSAAISSARSCVKLRSLASGGESLGDEMLSWGRHTQTLRSTSSTARPNAIWWSPLAAHCFHRARVSWARRFRVTMFESSTTMGA